MFLSIPTQNMRSSVAGVYTAHARINVYHFFSRSWSCTSNGSLLSFPQLWISMFSYILLCVAHTATTA